jgi:hypothetical protein
MRVWARRVVLLVMAALVVAQFIPVGRTNPPVDAAQTISATTPIPPDVASILDRSCQDCHTSRTVWPWYGQVAPASWFLAHHVNEGRDELNLSDWGRYTARRKDRKLKEICEQATQGKMPLASYTLLHPQANLSDRDKKMLCDWTEAERKSLAASAATVPGR